MKPIKVYNLLNANGDKLTLRLGYDPALRGTTGDNDCGMRWSFEGKCIPMPTRGWFNGFPEETMLNWLNENGWVVRCIVDIPSGKATVYDLLEAPEDADDDRLVKGAIRAYYRGDNLWKCAKLYRMLTGETNITASKNAVEAILGRLLTERNAPATKTETDWIPVSSGQYPKDEDNVQVTFLSASDRTPSCEGVAYRYKGEWFWSDCDKKVYVEIAAWKPIGEPYKGEAASVTEINLA